MLYPKKINAKKRKNILAIAIVISVGIALGLYCINTWINPQVPWSVLCIACILYGWCVTIYSIYHNHNVAEYVLIQAIAISALMIGIDLLFGKKMWSFSIGIPIILIATNTIMLVLTIVNRKNFLKYSICQLIICIISISPIIFIQQHLIEFWILSIIAVGISGLNLVLCILLCRKDIMSELKRKFHF